MKSTCFGLQFSFDTSCIPPNEGSKFELDCVESKNSCILLIDIISFKLRLTKFVYIFLRHSVQNHVLKTIDNDLNRGPMTLRQKRFETIRKYSDTSLQRTPLGPRKSVRYEEVSAI